MLNYLHMLDEVEAQDWPFIVTLHRPRLQVLSLEYWCYLVAWLSSQLNCCTCLLLCVHFWHCSRLPGLQWLSMLLFEQKEEDGEYICLETSGPGLPHRPFPDIPSSTCLSWNYQASCYKYSICGYLLVLLVGYCLISTESDCFVQFLSIPSETICTVLFRFCSVSYRSFQASEICMDLSIGFLV